MDWACVIVICCWTDAADGNFPPQASQMNGFWVYSFSLNHEYATGSLLVCAETSHAKWSLKDCFHGRSRAKRYRVIVFGKFEPNQVYEIMENMMTRRIMPKRGELLVCAETSHAKWSLKDCFHGRSRAKRFRVIVFGKFERIKYMKSWWRDG